MAPTARIAPVAISSRARSDALTSRSLELIAKAALCLDLDGRRRQLAAQPRDELLDGVGTGVLVEAEQLLDQLLLGDIASGPRGKNLQHGELAAREVERLAGH